MLFKAEEEVTIATDTPRKLEVPAQAIKAAFVEPILLPLTSGLPGKLRLGKRTEIDGYRAVCGQNKPSSRC
jgi:hypothetical protein